MDDGMVRDALERDGCILVKLRLGGEAYFKEEHLVARICNNCKEMKLKSDFNKLKNGPGGIKPVCRICSSLKNKEYKAKNKEKIRKSSKLYREANREAINIKIREYKKENIKKVRESDRVYRENNKEEIAARQKDWYLRNPSKARLPKLKRRARLSRLPDTFTKEEYRIMMDFFSWSCALTGEIRNLHNDHAIPLSTGFGGTTVFNIIPLKAELNLSKNDSNFFIWFHENKTRFNISQAKFDKTIEYLAGMNGMTPQEYKEYVYKCHEGKREGEIDWCVS